MIPVRPKSVANDLVGSREPSMMTAEGLPATPDSDMSFCRSRRPRFGRSVPMGSGQTHGAVGVERQGSPPGCSTIRDKQYLPGASTTVAPSFGLSNAAYSSSTLLTKIVEVSAADAIDASAAEPNAAINTAAITNCCPRLWQYPSKLLRIMWPPRLRRFPSRRTERRASTFYFVES